MSINPLMMGYKGGDLY